jgi:hypothetical protein
MISMALVLGLSDDLDTRPVGQNVHHDLYMAGMSFSIT